jgi:hypothetical protein
VQHGEILHVAAGADADAVDIAADNAVVPDTRLWAHFDITNYNGGFGHECARVNFWLHTLKGSVHMPFPPHVVVTALENIPASQ